VVGYTANLVRATPGTTLTSLGTGRYDVKFPVSVHKCAYLATVEVVPGPARNTIGFQVRSLLFFGGNPENESFHTAIVC